MSLVACGLNHKTSPIALREQVALMPDRLESALNELVAQGRANEVAILSTCNRTEFYCATNDEQGILGWVSDTFAVAPQLLRPHVYIHRDDAAVQHIIRVASGLDSMILGEPQIFGQMKQAFFTAYDAGTLGPELGRLFQYIFAASKRIRTEIAIGTNPVSVAYTAVSLASHVFSDLGHCRALLIGAGETIELALHHLHSKQLKQLFVANRDVQKARDLAERFGAQALPLQELPSHLPQADIVISATSSPLPIICKSMTQRAVKARKHRPILMIDIAVPRDIDPLVGSLNDIYLYNIDDLRQIIDDNLQDRAHAATFAEELIALETSHYMCWLRSLDAVNLIRAYREQAEDLCAVSLARAKRALAKGDSIDHVLDQLARGLTNKLIHTPSKQMRQAGYDGQFELLALARQLFELDPN